MGRRDNFRETLGLVRDGQFVSETEMKEAWMYAQGGVFEAFKLCEGLMAGYRAQQETIKRKDSLLEAKIRQLQAMDRRVRELEKRLKEAGADGDATSSGAARHLPLKGKASGGGTDG